MLYFSGLMKENLLNRFTFTYPKEPRRQMQPKYGSRRTARHWQSSDALIFQYRICVNCYESLRPTQILFVRNGQNTSTKSVFIADVTLFLLNTVESMFVSLTAGWRSFLLYIAGGEVALVPAIGLVGNGAGEEALLHFSHHQDTTR